MSLQLTSTEAADLLSVHPSTVKRWCNEGELAYETTDGGHRRIPLADAVAFARREAIPTVLTPFHPFEAHVWAALRDVEDRGAWARFHALAMGWATRSELGRLEGLLLAVGRSTRISLCDLFDHGVRGFMEQVGTAWSEGKLRVGDEHLISQVVTEALLRLRADASPREDARRVAIVGTSEGNHHALGALCIRILLERAGWRVYYVGPDLPIEDFGILQRSRTADLVCVSLAPVGTAGDATRLVSLLSELYDPSHPHDLVLGTPSHAGIGEVLQRMESGSPFRSLRCFDSSHTLLAWLEQTHPEEAR